MSRYRPQKRLESDTHTHTHTITRRQAVVETPRVPAATSPRPSRPRCRLSSVGACVCTAHGSASGQQ
eukprot:2972256-Prymnesium_polylepis.2